MSNTVKTLIAALALLPGNANNHAARMADKPALLPEPSSVQWLEGTFPLSRDTGIVVSRGAKAEAASLARSLALGTGFSLKVQTAPTKRGAIRLEKDAALTGKLGAEGYHLTVQPDQVKIRAASDAGLFYGGITLRQLLPSGFWGLEASGDQARSGPDAWEIPCVEIVDTPRFSWRGALLDPARHFLPLQDLKRFVDLMAMHKLNRLQLHLTDDQGWRIEIRKYPRLTQVGSIRSESPKPGARDSGDGTPYGPFFYTQNQMRELVQYAQQRHVTLVPEIEMPGHFLAALAAYPELSCTGGPFQVRTRWGVEEDILCAGNDAAVKFAQNVLSEIASVFPGDFVHIGGDEAPRSRWKTCQKCQARIKEERLGGEPALQSWFNQNMERTLASKKKRMIGWDEILEGGVTPGTAVMSWRGTVGGLAAASAGHDVVMSPTSHCYLDYAQSKLPGEPESIGGYIPLATVYSFDPIPRELAPAQHRHILGVQGNLWSEYLHSIQDVEYFAFPRMAALAEVGWSPSERTEYPSFQARLQSHLQRLDAAGVHYCRTAF